MEPSKLYKVVRYEYYCKRCGTRNWAHYKINWKEGDKLFPCYNCNAVNIVGEVKDK